jgi:FeS assembly protein IscX
MPNELTWADANKIAVHLVDVHPKIAPDTIALKEVHGYVTALDDFKGDPQLFDEPTLTTIRDAWNTEFLERTRNWA